MAWIEKEAFLTKNFKFSNFKEAFGFMTQVAFEAEAMNHHPNWENVYNQVFIRLSTHDENKITDKDHQLAQAIDQVYHQFLKK